MTRALPVTVEGRAAATVERTFEVIVPIDLASIFTGYGPLPGVTGTREQTGDWDHAGASRVVELADGSTAGEQLTAVDPPASFAYRVGPFSGSLRWLVTHADGDWAFTPAGTGTAIRWTYTFHARPGRSTLLRLTVVPLWRRYMRAALDRAIAQV